jgi:hypothetical protein
MTYKAYIDNIYAKTGKGPENYRKMAKEKGLTMYAELLKCIQNPELGKKKIAEDAKRE